MYALCVLMGRCKSYTALSSCCCIFHCYSIFTSKIDDDGNESIVLAKATTTGHSRSSYYASDQIILNCTTLDHAKIHATYIRNAVRVRCDVALNSSTNSVQEGARRP